MRIFWFVVLPTLLVWLLSTSLQSTVSAALLGLLLMALTSSKNGSKGQGRAYNGKRRYLPERVDDLEREVRELRQRLAALERQQGMPAAMPEQQAAQKQPALGGGVAFSGVFH